MAQRKFLSRTNIGAVSSLGGNRVADEAAILSRIQKSRHEQAFQAIASGAVAGLGSVTPIHTDELSEEDAMPTYPITIDKAIITDSTIYQADISFNLIEQNRIKSHLLNTEIKLAHGYYPLTTVRRAPRLFAGMPEFALFSMDGYMNTKGIPETRPDPPYFYLTGAFENAAAGAANIRVEVFITTMYYFYQTLSASPDGALTYGDCESLYDHTFNVVTGAVVKIDPINTRFQPAAGGFLENAILYGLAGPCVVWAMVSTNQPATCPIWLSLFLSNYGNYGFNI